MVGYNVESEPHNFQDCIGKIEICYIRNVWWVVGNASSDYAIKLRVERYLQRWRIWIILWMSSKQNLSNKVWKFLWREVK